MSRWVRLWIDMPTDPKWRVIAKRAGRPISETLAVFMFMLANAGERNETQSNADERGVLVNWSDEDVAAALDIETAHVTAICEAMQGKTLDGNKLTGWEKRQPKREDGSSERSKEWRERKRTQANAEKRPDPDSSELESNLPSKELEPAIVGEQRVADLMEGVGVGTKRHVPITAETKLIVCKTLDIADAEPLVRVFDKWTENKPAKKSRDAWFRSLAETLWKNNPAVHAECRPLNEHPPPEPARPAKAGPELLANLMKDQRNAH